MRKIYIETYGCQMNVSDSEVILSILSRHDYVRTDEIGSADVIMANTCSIRDNAEQRIWNRLEQFARYRSAQGRRVVIGIVGCMAERLGEKLTESGKVDIVAGPDSYRNLPAMLEQAFAGTPAVSVTLSREETYSDIMPLRTDRSGVSAFISIMRGCNNCCSYCIVPYTRGAERSRDAASIVAEARKAFEDGYKEVCLLGQNVDSYLWKGCRAGLQEGGAVDFADLLEMVAAISPALRVRFATSHPKDISDKVLRTMAAHPNICRHIHLPVQSGSNVMLEKMRRKYTREWYLERVAKIRQVLPDCGITTDVIAGFCGETEQDHADTLSLFEQVGFDSAFMFQYSERPGTLASKKYPDDVPAAVKTARLNEIIELQGRKSLERYSLQVGKTLEVLVEGPSKKGDGQMCGRASNNMMCVWNDTVSRPGDYISVIVKGCTPATLLCERI